MIDWEKEAREFVDELWSKSSEGSRLLIAERLADRARRMAAKVLREEAAEPDSDYAVSCERLERRARELEEGHGR